MRKNYKVFLVPLLVFSLLICSIVPGYAATQTDKIAAFYDPQKAAEELNKVGLFKGDDNGFSLERVPTRAEVAAMFVRLLGKEQEALSGEYTHPFTDANMWASKYIGYMYKNGLTKGVSETRFAPYETANANMYLTFALRALGYDSSTDFQWDQAAVKAAESGIITSSAQDKKMLENFDRGGLALISYRMLFAIPKNGLFPLVYELIEEGSLDVEAVYNTQLGEALDGIELINFRDIYGNISSEDFIYRYLMDYFGDSPEKFADVIGIDEETLKDLMTSDNVDSILNSEHFTNIVSFLFDNVFKMPKVIDYKVKNYWMEKGIDYTDEINLKDLLGCNLRYKDLSWILILAYSEEAYNDGTVLYVRDIDSILNFMELYLYQFTNSGIDFQQYFSD